MNASPDPDGTWILEVLRYEELQEEHRREMSALLVSLLEVMDSFDHLLAGAGQTAGAPSGTSTCQIIARQLRTVLERVNVHPMRCVGQPVNIDLHEVVGVRPVATEQVDVVLEEVRRGYEWDGRLLRAAQVIVGRSSKEDLG